MRKELTSIQYLRAIAALMVVFFHLELQLRGLGYRGFWPTGLAGGVDIFFVITGFIMWVTTYDRDPSPVSFYRRRLVRIVPLYWLLTSVILLVLIVRPSALQSGGFDLGHIVRSYLFIPSLHPVLHDMQPLLVPGWTLNYEMFFYLLFGASLLLDRSRRLAVVIGALAALVLVNVLAEPDPDTLLGFYTSKLILEFALGLAIGSLFTWGARLPVWLGWGMVASGFVALFGLSVALPETDRLFKLGVPAAFIVAGALAVERGGGIVPSWPLLHRLGDASYSIYLSHGIVLSALGQAARRFEIASVPVGLLVFSAVAIAATAIAGLLLYRYVEQPVLMLMTRRLASRAQVEA